MWKKMTGLIMSGCSLSLFHFLTLFFNVPEGRTHDLMHTSEQHQLLILVFLLASPLWQSGANSRDFCLLESGWVLKQFLGFQAFPRLSSLVQGPFFWQEVRVHWLVVNQNVITGKNFILWILHPIGRLPIFLMFTLLMEWQLHHLLHVVQGQVMITTLHVKSDFMF